MAEVDVIDLCTTLRMLGLCQTFKTKLKRDTRESKKKNKAKKSALFPQHNYCPHTAVCTCTYGQYYSDSVRNSRNGSLILIAPFSSWLYSVSMCVPIATARRKMTIYLISLVERCVRCQTHRRILAQNGESAVHIDIWIDKFKSRKHK